jgi:hypothetical protein
LAEELVGFLDLELESSIVNKISMDISHWKVDKHACNLGSLLFACKCLNEFIDELSDLTLIVRIVWSNTW